MTKVMDEQLKLAHKVVDVVDRPNGKNCVTLLWYKMDKPEKSYTEVRLFPRKKKDEKIQKNVLVNYKLEELIQLLDVLNSV